MGVLGALSASYLLAQERFPSPDNELYAIPERAQNAGKGREVERFSIFTVAGKLVSVLHIWLEEPDGTMRVGARGCEKSGWIDSKRFFCEGSGNPSMGVYRWFNARSGKEIGEAIGSEFTWSPDLTELAYFGNVPHFTGEDEKSDSLEVGRYTWPKGATTPEQHWFRSSVSWSSDSKFVAVVDHQRRSRKAFFLVILDRSDGKTTEHKLNLPDETDEWYPDHDFRIGWAAGRVTVVRGGFAQTFQR